MNRRIRSVPSGLASLEPFADAGLLEPIDLQLTSWVCRAAAPAVVTPLVQLAIACASWAARSGHSYLDLGRVTEFVTPRPDTDPLPWPEPSAWLAELAAAPTTVVRTVQGFDPSTYPGTEPLVLHGRHVYLQRHWADECAVAASLRARTSSIAVELDASSQALFDQVLPALDVDGRPSQQRAAALTVLREHLSLVVGGPGTGKTHSVALLLAVLIDHELRQGRHLRVALAAPTGKAAARMQEAIAGVLHNPEVAAHIPAEVAAQIADLQPTTIHRMLGSRGGSSQRFRHDERQQLPHEVVIIDEASMVSTPLLARVCEAVRPDARLVLIGDPDQLESVDRGRVLGDLVRASESATSPLHGRVVRLLRSHRFGGDSAVARLANAIRTQTYDDVSVTIPDGQVRHIESDAAGGTTEFLRTSHPDEPSALEAVRAELEPALSAMRAAAESGDTAEALRAGTRVRILCAHREGPFGVAHWNVLSEGWLRGATHDGSRWYAGRPLLATRNDPRLGVANGDTGVVVRHHGRLLAAFTTGQGVRYFEQVQLNDVETAYAITVHKSQGSEYGTVVFILPPAASPLASRELAYTAVTRAKRRVVTIGTPEQMKACVSRAAERMTGLTEALRR